MGLESTRSEPGEYPQRVLEVPQLFCGYPQQSSGAHFQREHQISGVL